MIEIIKDLIEDAKHGSLLAIIILFMFAGVGVMVLLLAFYIIDSTNLPTKDLPATVINKHYSPEHYSPMITTVNGVTTTTMIYYPPSWSIETKSILNIVSCSVSVGYFNQLKIDDEIIISVASGRFSDSNYCKGVTL